MYYQFRAQRRRRSGVGCLILLGIILAGGFFFYTNVAKDKVITMKTHPTIVVRNCSNLVVVKTNTSENQVILPAGIGNLFPQYTLNQDQNVLILNPCDHSADDTDIQVSVPVHSNLNIESDDISVFGVTGEIKLDTNGGRISLIDSTVTGQSLLSNNGGITIFDGQLAPQSTLSCDLNGGLVDITLPKRSAFRLNVSGIIDTITTNFTGIPDNATEIKTNIGSDPQATLKMHVNSGPIVLHGV